MKWYRFFKSSDDGTTVTVSSGVTLVVKSALTAASAAITGAVSAASASITGAIDSATATFSGAATDGVGKLFLTLGVPPTGPTIYFIIGAGFTADGPTPSHAGDIYIDTTAGKMYIAGAATATSDWKLVTSA